MKAMRIAKHSSYWDCFSISSIFTRTSASQGAVTPASEIPSEGMPAKSSNQRHHDLVVMRTILRDDSLA